ncbi:MAG: hypothetical protein ACI9J3_000586 [Parvicellaceae bacterium]|jgi:hypothetical protein
MYFKSLLLIPFFFLTLFVGYAQQPSTYSNNIENIGTVVSSFVDNNGNIVSCSEDGYGDLIVLKTDASDGSIINEFVIQFPVNVYVKHSALAANGDYLFVARDHLSDYGDPDLIVIRMNSSGSILWNQHFVSDHFFPEFIKETPGGEIIVGGQTWEGWAQSAFAAKLDWTGALIWVEIYDNYEGKFHDVEFIGSDYLFVGESYITGPSGHTTGLLVRTNSSGALVTMQDVEGGIGTSFKRIVKRDDGGFFIAGTVAGNIGGEDALIAAYDSFGNYEWAHAYGGLQYDRVSDMDKVGTNEYVVSGLTKSLDFVSEVGWYFKISSTGFLIWSKAVGANTGQDNVKSVSVLTTNELILSVENNSESAPHQSIKTNDLGETSCDMEEFTPLDQPISLITTVISLPSQLGWTFSDSSPSTAIWPFNLSSISQNCQVSAVESTTYHKLIAGPGNDRITDIQATLDGGAIAVGSASTGVHGGVDIFAVRLNNEGDTLWTKFYGTSTDDNTEGVLVKHDGGFLIMNGAKNTLINVDSEGGLVNSMTFDGQVGASKMCLTSDNKVLVGLDQGKIIKLDANLNVEWQIQYSHGSFTINVKDIYESSNGDYLVCSTHSWSGIGVMRLASDGTVSWFKEYYDFAGGSQQGSGIVETPQGKIIVCGTHDGGFLDDKSVVLKLDGAGTLLSAKTLFGIQASDANAIEIKENNIYVAGYNLDFTGNESSAVLAKIDTNLNIQWAKVYGAYNVLDPNIEDEFFAVDVAVDGSILLGGKTRHYGNGTKEFLLIKTDSLGNMAGCHVTPKTYVQNPLTISESSYVVTANTSSPGSASPTIEGTLSVPILDFNFEVSSNIVNNLCNASSNGSAEAVVVGGVPLLNYSWVNVPDGTQVGTSALLENMQEGQYIVTVTDETGCQVMDTVNLLDPDAMSSMINITNPLCAGTNTGTAEIIIVGGETPYTYQWNSGQITAQASNILEGNYAVNVLDGNGCLHSNLATLIDPDPLAVLFTSIPSTCGAADGSITASATGGNNVFTYSWDNSVNVALNDNIGSGAYEVTATDSNGCQVIELFNLSSQVIPTEICVITVDSLNRNLIVWEKPIVGNIEGYYIYRNIAGAYAQIGYQPYDSISEYVDLSFGVDPSVTSYRYEISVLDSCGIESALSDFHETIHLTTNLGGSGEVNLIWDDYEGFVYPQYKILRDSTGLGNWELIDSVSASNFTYTDWTPPSSINLDYLIEVVVPAPCTSQKANGYNGSRSNRGKSGISGVTGMDELILSQIKLYPNPNQGLFTISSSTDDWNYEILDIQGRLLMQESAATSRSIIDVKHLNSGVYLVRITVGESQIIKRIIKQ